MSNLSFLSSPLRNGPCFAHLPSAGNLHILLQKLLLPGQMQPPQNPPELNCLPQPVSTAACGEVKAATCSKANAAVHKLMTLVASPQVVDMASPQVVDMASPINIKLPAPRICLLEPAPRMCPRRPNPRKCPQEYTSRMHPPEANGFLDMTFSLDFTAPLLLPQLHWFQPGPLLQSKL